MTRTVKVELEAGTARYIAPVDDAALATERLDHKVSELDRDLKKVPDDALKAAASMRLLGGDAEGVGKKLHDLGPNATNSLELIDKKIVETQAHVRKFAEDFNKTGSADALSLLHGSASDLKELETLRKQIASALGEGGKEGTKSIMASLNGMLSNPVFGPITVGMIAGAIAVSAPAIGAAIGAAVIGGGGLGLIGLGIAGQIHSPPVMAAWEQLKERARTDLTEASSAFGPVLVKGLHGFSDEINHLMPGLQRDFAKLAMPASRLFEGVGGFLNKLGPGFEALASAAAPFIDQLAAELPRLGSAFSSMFTDISSNAPGAILFFHDLMMFLDGVLIMTGKITGGLENAYGKIRTFTSAFHGDIAGTVASLLGIKGAQEEAGKGADKLALQMQTAAASIDLAGGKAMSASDQYGQLVSKMNAMNNTADTVAGALSDKLLGAMMGTDEATLHWNESLTKLSVDLIKGKDSLDIHTAAGQKNIGAILAAVQANIAAYDQNIKVGMSAQDAATAYDVNTAALERQLRKAGLTQAQIDGLIGKYRGVPTNVDTDIALHGLTEAIDGLSNLLGYIHGIPNYKQIRIVTTYEDAKHSGPAPNPNQGYAQGGVRRAAVGMVLPPRDPGTVLAGEPQTGGEVLTPLRGISQGRAMQLSQMVGDSYGFNVVPRGRFAAAGGGSHMTVYNHNVTVNAAPGTSGAEVGAQIVQVIKKYEQANGAGWRR